MNEHENTNESGEPRNTIGYPPPGSKPGTPEIDSAEWWHRQQRERARDELDQRRKKK